MKKLLRCIKNYFFCLKYPFWKSRNVWDGKFMGYSFTWYDDIPKGWQKAFGKQLSKDIKKAGIPYIKQGKKWEDILSFQQIKEKWGELCLYASTIDEIQNVLDKYELMSSGYCINCGKPARYRTEGWIEYYCEKCFEKTAWGNLEDIKEQKEKCRLTQKDIPSLCNYEYRLIKTETFSSEEDCIKKYENLWNNPNKPEDEVYNKVLDIAIEYKQRIKHEVNIKEKYGIDFESLWGLK